MTKNILIFGISGQDGFYLNGICEAQGYNVIGVSRSSGKWLQGSVADKELVVDLIINHQPCFIFHLAANSSTSHKLIYENNETICNGSIHILEAVYKHSKHTKIFLSGSGLQFINRGLPIIETDEFFAASPYAAQRIYTTFLARYYRTLGIQTYMGYFFHHDSPLRSDRHLNIKIVNTALNIKAGRKEIIELGNIEVIKEFNHALDMMNAIWLLVNQEEVFEAVIGSGKGYTINNWIEICAEIIGINLHQYVTIKNGFMADFDTLICDPVTISKLGWVPFYCIKLLAKTIIEQRIKNYA